MTAELIREVMKDMSEVEEKILRNLNSVALEVQRSFQQNFNDEDFVLSEEFKLAFGRFLRSNGQNISFQEHTAVITRAGNLKIYAPNQWFVMATYMVDLVRELINYKGHLEEILRKAELSTDDKKKYIKNLKATNDIKVIEEFKRNTTDYFKGICDTEEDVVTYTEYMTRFVSDYEWWFGSKTVDRTNDYYVSPVLSLLGVVNASQGYVADAAYYFATDVNLQIASKNMIGEKATSLAIKTDRGKKEERKTGGQNLIVYGAPGTGKSRWLEDEFGTEPLTRRVVFHPEYTYFDFVGTYKPVPIYKKTDGEFQNGYINEITNEEPYIDYQFVPGPFITILIEAWLDPKEMYTLLIEEINRASAAAVFGEIFQLLDRRSNGSSEYSYMPSKDLKAYLAKLPELEKYFENGIRIPSNMNIVATMNSADQGVNLIDSAFKRRWNYKYLRIDIGSAVHGGVPIHYAGTKVNWGVFVTALNEKLINSRIDEDKLIGPYFIKPEELKNISALDKLLLYLWDDVLRHQRSQFFSKDVRSFADLSDLFAGTDVLELKSYFVNAGLVDLESETNKDEDDTDISEIEE